MRATTLPSGSPPSSGIARGRTWALVGSAALGVALLAGCGSNDARVRATADTTHQPGELPFPADSTGSGLCFAVPPQSGDGGGVPETLLPASEEQRAIEIARRYPDLRGALDAPGTEIPAAGPWDVDRSDGAHRIGIYLDVEFAESTEISPSWGAYADSERSEGPTPTTPDGYDILAPLPPDEHANYLTARSATIWVSFERDRVWAVIAGPEPRYCS